MRCVGISTSPQIDFLLVFMPEPTTGTRLEHFNLCPIICIFSHMYISGRLDSVFGTSTH